MNVECVISPELKLVNVYRDTKQIGVVNLDANENPTLTLYVDSYNHIKVTFEELDVISDNVNQLLEMLKKRKMFIDTL